MRYYDNMNLDFYNFIKFFIKFKHAFKKKSQKLFTFSIQYQLLSKEERLIWPRVYPRKANLSDVLSIDIDFIGVVDADNGHLRMLTTPYEVAIVDANLNTVFRSRCRPKTLPKMDKLRDVDWRGIQINRTEFRIVWHMPRKI